MAPNIATMAAPVLPPKLVALVTVLATAAYLLVLDLGVSAGRVHHGVSVQGTDLGGLTEPEAVERLQQRARELKQEPIAIAGRGLELMVLPTDVRWRPRAEDTARRAADLGRAGGPLGALWDRLRAWFGAVEVDWAGKPHAAKMVALVESIDAEAEARGLDVYRATLRRRIRMAMAAWPRRPVAIPFKDS